MAGLIGPTITHPRALKRRFPSNFAELVIGFPGPAFFGMMKDPLVISGVSLLRLEGFTCERKQEHIAQSRLGFGGFLFFLHNGSSDTDQAFVPIDIVPA